jgi:hypothetical protein
MNNPFDDTQKESEDKVTRRVAGVGIAALLILIGAVAVSLLLLFTTSGSRVFDVMLLLFPFWFLVPLWALSYARRKGHGGWNESGGGLLSFGEIGMVLAVLFLPFIGLFALVETFQSGISMDGATCLKANDGSVSIRRHTLRNVLALVSVSVGASGLGLLVWVGRDMLSDKDSAAPVGVGILIIGVVLFTIGRSAVRSLRQPSFYIDANSRLIESGRGSTAQQIFFSRIAYLSTTPPTKSSLEGVTRIGIQVTLDNGEVIKLGSVSGPDANKARTRATAIAQLVAEVTGAAIREPDGSSESIESIRERRPAVQPQAASKPGKMRLILIGLILLLLSIVVMLLLPQR